MTTIQTHENDACEDTCYEILKTAMGDLIEYFLDDEIIEISLNPDRKIWLDRLGKGRKWSEKYMSEADATNFISIVASMTHTTITPASPILSTEIPYYGCRFEANIPPIVERPIFSIRKKATMIFTLDDYVKQKIMTTQQAAAVRQAVKNKENILVVGGTGTGKTTFSNAILTEFAHLKDRILILQDVKELQCEAEDVVDMRTSDDVDMRRLLKSCMRHSPKRIVIGEVRDAVALTLLKSWNTGHPGGLCTVHANSAYDGLIRIEQLIQEAIITPQQRLIAAAINIIVYMEHVGNHRRIKEILRLKGYDSKDNDYIFEQIA